MLREIELIDFKCFDKLRLPLSELTILSGTNASGKSSLLQALVLLHQTMREHEWSTRLILNGDAIKLGTVADVVDKVHGRRSLSIGIKDDEAVYEWVFGGERSEMSMAVEKVSVDGEVVENPGLLQHLLPFTPGKQSHRRLAYLPRLTYITAERVGPREFYALEDRQIASVVGPQGEHAISVLHLGRDEAVLKGIVLDDVPATRLRQVEARMAKFFPGCALIVQQVPQANAVTLGLRTSDDTDFHRPINVGFGLTQVLPIVVAALSANAGDVILIENPEVHLHPSGQALMGHFLGEVAEAGVQVIVETHSDHVLSGVRRAVKAQTIAAENVAIHFFRPRGVSAAQVHSPIVDADGNIDSWPEGFFDQFDKDMNFFAGWGK